MSLESITIHSQGRGSSQSENLGRGVFETTIKAAGIARLQIPEVTESKFYHFNPDKNDDGVDTVYIAPAIYLSFWTDDIEKNVTVRKYEQTTDSLAKVRATPQEFFDHVKDAKDITMVTLKYTNKKPINIRVPFKYNEAVDSYDEQYHENLLQKVMEVPEEIIGDPFIDPEVNPGRLNIVIK